MIFEEELPLDNSKQKWTPWFAWYPVTIQSYPNQITAWLEPVERKPQQVYSFRFYEYRLKG